VTGKIARVVRAVVRNGGEEPPRGSARETGEVEAALRAAGGAAGATEELLKAMRGPGASA
jgi:hypothetical protein